MFISYILFLFLYFYFINDFFYFFFTDKFGGFGRQRFDNAYGIVKLSQLMSKSLSIFKVIIH